jgi:probable F420-dependent oxidoreductase
MLIGVSMFATDYAIQIDDLAREAEARGFESLWVPEHTHIPSSRRTPWPGGAELPKEYSHSYDPFVALMFAAAVTSTIKIGTGICLVIERDTITMAKEIASLDRLSGGRFLFGVGGGWNAEEMEHHGTAFKTRFRKMVEQVQALKTIWTQDEAEFHGDFVNFDALWSWPKPLQQPHPPIFLGGETSYTLQRVVDYCDGWLPRSRRPELILQGIGELRERAAKAGRDMKTISVTASGAPGDPKLVDSYREAGCDRCIFSLPSAERDTVLPLLDKYTSFIQ